MASITVGVVGLGRMGQSVAYRLKKSGFSVVGFDFSENACNDAKIIGIDVASSLQDLGKHARIIWLMVPAGKPVDDVIQEMSQSFQADDIIIDGGNSFYKDSVRRAQELAKRNVHFLDCGTSGGLHGREIGFSLMIGGDKQSFHRIEDVFKAIAAPHGYQHLGTSGAGHFVKMVHNGIEYALLQAYAEGFQLLKEGPFQNLDLEHVASVWNHGSIIRSWIVELSKNILSHDQSFKDVSGNIGENLTGRWTVDVAKEYNIPVRTIEEALDIRAWSRETGGNYATKFVALLRHEFGGHPVKKVKHD